MFIPRAPLIKMQSAPGALRVLHVENLSPGLARRASVLNHEARVNANSFVKRCILTNNMRELPEWARACVLGACACAFLFFSYERRQSCTKTLIFPFSYSFFWHDSGLTDPQRRGPFFNPPLLLSSCPVREKLKENHSTRFSLLFSPRCMQIEESICISPPHPHWDFMIWLLNTNISPVFPCTSSCRFPKCMFRYLNLWQFTGMIRETASESHMRLCRPAKYSHVWIRSAMSCQSNFTWCFPTLGFPFQKMWS